MMHPDEQEEMDMRFTTIAESDRASASWIGSQHPDRAWIVSDRDAWYPNPYYTGAPVPCPEYDDYDQDAAPVKVDPLHDIFPLFDPPLFDENPEIPF